MTIKEIIIALATHHVAPLPAQRDFAKALAYLIKNESLTIESSINLIGDEAIACTEDGILIVYPGQWTAKDTGGGEMEIEADNAHDAAKEFFEGNDWEPGSVEVHAWRTGIDSDGDIVRVGKETHSFEVDTPEPECEDSAGHDWQNPHRIVGGIKENPGVWGSNHGGVSITSVCMKCGCKRVVDTGATDYSSGLRCTTTEYDQGYYAEEIAAARPR